MPHWLQMMTYAVPLRYFLVVLRGTYLKGVGMSVLWPQMAAMGRPGSGSAWTCPFSASASRWISSGAVRSGRPRKH